jgi:ferredoxin
MANVTFTSPRMQRDLTVYAVAGDTHTLLSVAKKNKVPLTPTARTASAAPA